MSADTQHDPIRTSVTGDAAFTIRYAVRPCALGLVLVAAGGRGVCAVMMGDDRAALVCELLVRFPEAVPAGADRSFDRGVERVVRVVEAPEHRFDLPLDLRGTPFQRRVWRALRRIPAGRTATYGEIAGRIGARSAARAVAAACAANPLAVIVPCHRVVRSDGSLSGYRWGVDRKRRLLQREAAA